MNKKFLLGIVGTVLGLLIAFVLGGDSLMGNAPTPVRVNYTSPISFVSPTKATTTYGSELFVNGGLETWTSSTQPADWVFTDFTLGGTGATLTQSATTTGASSTSSARLENNAGGDAFAVLSQSFTCTPSSTYAIGGYFASDAASKVSLMITNEDLYASSTEIYDSASSTWKAFNPAVDQPTTKNEDITDTFSLQGEQLTCPASGVISFSMIPNVESAAGAVLYADDLTAYEVITPANVTLMSFTNPSDASRMTANDIAWEMKTTGGTAYNWFYMDGTGALKTDLSNFNFGTKDIATSGGISASSSNISGGQSVKVRIVSTATTSIGLTDYILHVTKTSDEAVTTTLPTAGIANGNVYFVIDAGNNATTNNIVIDTEGDEKINTQDSISISTSAGHYNIYTDGTNWWAY